MSIRILLVNSHQIVLWALEKLINAESPRMEIIGKACNRSEALRLSGETNPDIILLGLSLGKEKGVDVVSDLLRERQFNIIIFTEIHDQAAVEKAVLNGARGVVYKEEPTQTIVKAIEKVHAGELWLDRYTIGRVFVDFVRAGQKPTDLLTKKITALTRKERTIVNAFANDPGASNKKIAQKLCISEQTLRNHLTSIFSKLEIKNRVDLFMFAKLHHHLISDSNPPNLSSARSPAGDR